MNVLQAQTADVPELPCIVRERGYVFTEEKAHRPEGSDPSGTFIEYQIYLQPGYLFTCQRIFWSGEEDEHSDVFRNLRISELGPLMYGWGRVNNAVLRQVGDYAKRMFEYAVKRKWPLKRVVRHFIDQEIKNRN